MFDWITVIILLLIVGIVLDGVRRVRASRRGEIKLSRNAKKADIEWGSDAEQTQSEFPSGGPRVVAYREENEAREHTENIKNSFHSSRVTSRSSSKIPEQVSLNLEESVPMLMESIELQAAQDSEKTPVGSEVLSDSRVENPELDIQDSTESENSFSRKSAVDENRDSLEPTIGSLDELDALENSEQVEPGSFQAEAWEELDDPLVSADDSKYDEPKKESLTERIHKKIDAFTSDRKSAGSDAKQSEPSKKSSQENSDKVNKNQDKETKQVEYVEPDEVLIVNIMAHPGEQFSGELLLNALMDEGMKLGNMDIFHRHHENNGDAPVVFSLANMVMPGTFNLAKMSEFSTPGVSMFLGLPVTGDSLAAYNDLIGTAQRIASAIDGELKDENRSVMTKQTIEHGKQRVIEYERKKKLERA